MNVTTQAKHTPGPWSADREAHRLKQLQGAASLLLDALKNCQSALLLYDGHATNPIDPQGWTESEGYSAYHDAEGAIQAAEGGAQ
jgi:hypothetical protein